MSTQTVNNIYKHIFGRKLHNIMTLGDAIETLRKMHLINEGEAAEKAISKKSGVLQCRKNMPESDLVTGEQIKHGLTNPDNKHSNGERKLIAYISTKQHTSTILAVVTERFTGKEYYFVFPYASYKHHNGNTIGIPFEYNGKPKLTNRWWQYNVETFNELCAKVNSL
jgi:hypothetical protein